MLPRLGLCVLGKSVCSTLQNHLSLLLKTEASEKQCSSMKGALDGRCLLGRMLGIRAPV